MAPSAASILVIEDNSENIELIEYLLTAYGYSPVLARDGPDGLRIALEMRPDLILLDLRMPGMDGYAVAAAIRLAPELAATRIVAVTASAMASDRARISDAGFDGYLQKPIDPTTFMQDLASFLTASGDPARTRSDGGLRPPAAAANGGAPPR